MLNFVWRRLKISRKGNANTSSLVKFLGKIEVTREPPRFGGEGIIEIGNGARFRNRPSLHVEDGGYIAIGARTFLNSGASI
jgi:hypothetical protein